MKKKYFFILTILISFALINKGYAQLNTSKPNTEIKQDINGLSIYPNPVGNGKVYITTTQNLAKEITIYDVLGKKIISEILFAKELNVSKLNSGVYILKIKEGDFSATRKLVVR